MLFLSSEVQQCEPSGFLLTSARVCTECSRFYGELAGKLIKISLLFLSIKGPSSFHADYVLRVLVVSCLFRTQFAFSLDDQIAKAAGVKFCPDNFVKLKEHASMFL